MASWIEQTLKLPGCEIRLLASSVEMRSDFDGHTVLFVPFGQDMAAQMAIGLRLAAKRLDEIGKGMA